MVNELAETIVKVNERAKRAEDSPQVQTDSVDKFEIHFEKTTIKDTTSVSAGYNRDVTETLTISDTDYRNRNLNTFVEGGHDRWGYFRWGYGRYAGMVTQETGTVQLNAETARDVVG